MDWDKIVSSAVSTLIGALVVGASIIVWNGATSVDDKIEAALENQEDLYTSAEAQRQYLSNAVEVIEKEMINLKNKVNDLTEANKALREKIEKRDYNIPLIPSGGGKVTTTEPEPEYFEDDFIQQQLPSIGAIPEPSRVPSRKR
jgi:hypothetical protein